MNNFKHMLEVSAAAKEAYSEGHAAGWQVALLKVQSELHEITMNSPANRNESRPENLVIMLSEVDTVINKMLEETNETYRCRPCTREDRGFGEGT